MNRYFPIYLGLTPGAPWGVACEHAAGSPKVELLALCRTEAEAEHYAALSGQGQDKVAGCAVKAGQGDAAGVGRKGT